MLASLVAIDPGTTRSALVALDENETPIVAQISDNVEVVRLLREWHNPPTLAIEMIASYGMPVGAEVFETCVWIGRFIEAYLGMHEKVYRKDVKMNLCHSMRAKDSNIRQALIDRYGGEGAVGTKDDKGPLYGVKKDMWSALAVGVTYLDHRHCLTED